MKPYYQDSAVTIYHADCSEILDSLEPADLLLTDPPYGIGKKMWAWRERVGTSLFPDHNIELELVFKAISKARASIVWGGNYYPLPVSRCWLGWIKRDGVDTASTLELAWTSFDRPSKYFDCTIASTNGERGEHPTIKPLRLMSWCLGFHPGTVLDPFMGSGTTLRAAKDLGRHAVGIDIEERFCEIAAKRMAQEVFDFK